MYCIVVMLCGNVYRPPAPHPRARGHGNDTASIIADVAVPQRHNSSSPASQSLLQFSARSPACVRQSIYNYYILVAPCFKKSFKIRSWIPSPQMPYFNKTQVTRTTHTTEEGHTPPQRLKKIPPGFSLVGIIIRDRDNFSFF